MDNTWIPLNTIEQLEQINLLSNTRFQIIFKHSTRCYISMMAYKELNWFTSENKTDYTFYYLDIIKYREISNEVSKVWKVTHESPQVLIIRSNFPVFNTSHEGITKDRLTKEIV